MSPSSSSFLFLYGPSGSGKSTLGAQLAERLHLPFYEMDQRIEQRAGKSIPQLFQAGESVFRDCEARELRAVLAEPAGVVSLGGGALLDENNRALAESRGRVLCLHAPLDVLSPAPAGQPGSRPLVAGDGQKEDPAARLAALLERRAARITLPSPPVRYRRRNTGRTPAAHDAALALSTWKVWVRPTRCVSCGRAESTRRAVHRIGHQRPAGAGVRRSPGPLYTPDAYWTT